MKRTLFKTAMRSFALVLAMALGFNSFAAAAVNVPTDTGKWTLVSHTDFKQGIAVSRTDDINNTVTIFQGGRPQVTYLKDNPAAVQTTYNYAGGVLATSVDMYGNKTSYNAAGQAYQTENAEGFVTSVTKFDGKGGVDKIESYGMISDGTKNADGSDHVTRTKIAETKYENGLAVRQEGLADPTKAQSTSNGWVTTAEYKYSGRQLVSVKDSAGNVTMYRADGRADYTKNDKDVVVQKNFYVNQKLDHTEDYDTSGVKTAIQNYDQYGRNTTTYIADEKGGYTRLQDTYNYNDTGAAKTFTANGHTYTIPAGGLMNKTSTLYSTDSNGAILATQEQVSYYQHGNPSSEADKFISETVVTEAGKAALNTSIKNSQLKISAGQDPTINGTIVASYDKDSSGKVTGTGSVALVVTNSAEKDKMLEALEQGLSNAKWANSVHNLKGSQLQTDFENMISAIKEQWSKDGKVSITLGAINESQMVAKEGVWNGGSQYKTVDSSKYWNDSLMTSMISRNGQSGTVTWNYWGVSGGGTADAKVYAFANSMK